MTYFDSLLNICILIGVEVRDCFDFFIAPIGVLAALWFDTVIINYLELCIVIRVILGVIDWLFEIVNGFCDGLDLERRRLIMILVRNRGVVQFIILVLFRIWSDRCLFIILIRLFLRVHICLPLWPDPTLDLWFRENYTLMLRFWLRLDLIVSFVLWLRRALLLNLVLLLPDLHLIFGLVFFRSLFLFFYRNLIRIIKFVVKDIINRVIIRGWRCIASFLVQFVRKWFRLVRI